jgi:hypothetical protein
VVNENAPKSLRCRHCRADNPVDATCCWLCDAADWVPLSRTSPKAVAPGGSGTLGLIAMTIALVGVMILVAVGIAGEAWFWLAFVVMIVWWIALASAAFIGFGRAGVRNPFIMAIATIGIVLGTLVVTSVSVWILLGLVCQVSGKTLNLH